MPFHELATRVHRDGRFVKVIRCGFLVLIPNIYNENTLTFTASVCLGGWGRFFWERLIKARIYRIRPDVVSPRGIR
jgi:hypothetical protein